MSKRRRENFIRQNMRTTEGLMPTGRLNTPPAQTDRLKRMLAGEWEASKEATSLRKKLGIDANGIRYHKEDVQLSGLALAALAQPDRGLMGWKKNKVAEISRRKVQSELATSQKFIVSNALVEHAVLASMARPKTLLDMVRRGVPSFNNMWIEWDEQFRQSVLQKYHNKNGLVYDLDRVPGHIGYHIQKKFDKYLYTTWLTMVDDEHSKDAGKLYATGLGFTIDNEQPWTPERYNNLLDTDKVTDEQVFDKYIRTVGGKLLGEWYVEKHKNDPLIDTLVFSFSQSHVDAQGLTPKGQQAGLSQDINAQLAAYSLKIQEGDGRFLIALLGLLNYDLIVQETHQTPKHIEYTRWGRRVPKNEHKIVTINLPKPRGKRIYDQMFSGQGTPKKEHWRRGHWRTYRDANGNVLRRVWIEEMKVGNPELGTIVHDYRLEKKTS